MKIIEKVLCRQSYELNITQLLHRLCKVLQVSQKWGLLESYFKFPSVVENNLQGFHQFFSITRWDFSLTYYNSNPKHKGLINIQWNIYILGSHVATQRPLVACGIKWPMGNPVKLRIKIRTRISYYKILSTTIIIK